MSSLEDLFNQQRYHNQALDDRFRALKDAMDQHARAQSLGGNFQGFLGGIPGANAAAQIADLNAKLRTLPKRKSPAERIKEIEHELQIIKGQVPTPKGYTITPAKAKELIKELRELQGKS